MPPPPARRCCLISAMMGAHARRPGRSPATQKVIGEWLVLVGVHRRPGCSSRWWPRRSATRRAHPVACKLGRAGAPDHEAPGDGSACRALLAGGVTQVNILIGTDHRQLLRRRGGVDDAGRPYLSAAARRGRRGASASRCCRSWRAGFARATADGADRDLQPRQTTEITLLLTPAFGDDRAAW